MDPVIPPQSRGGSSGGSSIAVNVPVEQATANLGPSDKVAAYSSVLQAALLAIEERTPIAGALIVIIGYVIIAAFGEIDNFWKYLAYISILCLGYFFYAFKKSKFSPREKVLVGIIAILAVYIAFAQGWFARLVELLTQKK